MTIFQISILAVVALVLGRLPKGRQLALLSVSAFVIFWLQPAEPFVSLKFWLPVATLTITVLAWALTSAPETRSWKQNWPAIAILAGVVVLMDLNRYFNLTQVYMSTTPQLMLTLIVLVLITIATLLLTFWQKSQRVFQIAVLRVEYTKAEGGSQIRSYVLYPYQMVKDHRAEYETGNTHAVLDGDLDAFMEAYLRQNA